MLMRLDFGFAKREEVFHRWDSHADGHSSSSHTTTHAVTATGGGGGGAGRIYGRGFRTVCGTLSYLAPEVAVFCSL